MKVLVVEDNAVNQKIATWRLQKLGHEVTVVENGNDALLAAERVAFDLILMDVQMPDMDGCEVTRLIRERETSTGDRHAYIVAMTALVLKNDADACLQAGMDDFMSKPLRPDRLEAIVEQARGLADPAAPELPVKPSPDEAYSLRAFIRRLDEADRSDVLNAARIFQKSLPGDLGAFRAAVARKDVEAICFQVHTLTGVSGVFEIPQLIRIGDAIEKAAAAADRPELENQCAAFDRALSHLIDEIDAVLDG